MIKYLLWDVDDTLLHTATVANESMRSGFSHFKLKELTDEGLDAYNVINNKYWNYLEEGKMSRDEILKGRFAEFFDYYGVPYDDKLLNDFNIHHQEELAKANKFNPFASETLDKLKEKGYKQYAVTNGTKLAQAGKLKASGLDNFLDGVFVSEEIGFDKPNPAFFEKVFEKIGSTDRSEYLLIGDSLTSDMRGANNAGLTNIWYNPIGKENNTDVKIDYTVTSLEEIPQILKTINE